MSITLSTCWYNFKAKFDTSTYQIWMHNMLTNVNNYNLVIYTDEDGFPLVEPYLKPNIKIIIKPYSEFFSFQFKADWIENQQNNHSINNLVDWRVNMLWSEKINFVYETVKQQYFKTDFYGWCDIGYFRGRSNDLNMDELRNWASEKIINSLSQDKIYYALVNNNNSYVNYIYTLVQNKNEKGLPNIQIPRNQCSIAGGFFILHAQNIDWWHNTYYHKLKLYFDNKYLVKDDQIIIADCIFSNTNFFTLCFENNTKYDNWFMFQRLLL